MSAADDRAIARQLRAHERSQERLAARAKRLAELARDISHEARMLAVLAPWRYRRDAGARAEIAAQARGAAEALQATMLPGWEAPPTTDDGEVDA